ncbi:hypothetical protein RhiirC2_785705 [Rhizophagus irregularis]|uniref:Uncharacterized protein n=1 Tax=Rhizophagus irregularis TaxID=588596 RepID=A0A2N1MVU9_9GLOM|nr:hypothetical protein RhiirC2_785705 [Rhizophagus irregularis]
MLEETFTRVCQFPNYGKNVEKIDNDSPEVASRRDSQSNTSSVSSVVGRMEKQLQINITETILEEPDQETDMDGEEEVITQPNIGNERRANEDTDSSSRKNLRNKYIQPEDSNILNELIRELFSNTTRLSEIKERKGLRRESI